MSKVVENVMYTYRTVRRVVLKDECGHPHNPVVLAGKILDAASDLYEQQTGEVPHPSYTSFYGIARDLERMGYNGYLSLFNNCASASPRKNTVSKRNTYGHIIFSLTVHDCKIVEIQVIE